MRYMVMECHPVYAVVLDEEGRFLKVANLRYEVGQTVTDVVEMQLPQTTAAEKPKNRWLGAMAAMAACLLLVVTSLFQQMPYASVYLSINPSVRIDVNRGDVVVGLEGVNRDGDHLIGDYTYQKKPLDQVTDELVDRAIDMGYLHQGGQITLELDAEDGAWVEKTGRSLGAHLQEHLTEKLSVTIQVSGREEGGAELTLPVTQTDADPDSSYGEEDYGGTAAPTPTPPVQTPPPGGDWTDDGQTDYGPAPEDGRSNYETAAPDDGQSNYETAEPDDGQSNYETTDLDDGQSNYETATPDDGQSNYETATPDDGQSNYETADPDDGQSNYETATPDDGQSNYETTVPDDGQSNYETTTPDDGQSNYDTTDTSDDDDDDDDDDD